jgi:GNAT superfamily N-acetyltransferase
MENIKVRLVRRVKGDEFVRLYREAGWWKPEYSKDLSFIKRIVGNSFCFVGAFHKNKMIGMGRSISDRISDAYIQDVTVLKKFRSRGIGGAIILRIIKYLKRRNIEWIGTIAEPGTQPFYKNLGFEALKDYKPMLFKETHPAGCRHRTGGNL